jgi:ABC-type dipeptide/oligopeptide/nickel transport system permease component
MLDALGSDFVRTARAKGLTERSVIARHALRNALIPIITVLGLDFGSYLTGSILTETIFSWPGLGRYVVNAIARRDLPAMKRSLSASRTNWSRSSMTTLSFHGIDGLAASSLVVQVR